jgi:tRNA dimethylallyltransferase
MGRRIGQTGHKRSPEPAVQISPSQNIETPIVCVVGPTASGKSDLALEIAELTNGEVVSADSVQIYRGFDIGSAKLTHSERARVPHHLIDALDPFDACDAARFSAMADALLQDIRARGKLAIVCGGTFLWVRALIYGLAEAPAADPVLRAEHRSLAERFGRAHLHDQLRDIDPVLHARLAPNDFVRVSRALEVHALTGKTLSSLQSAHGFRQARFAVQLVGVDHPRETLHARIAERSRSMLAQGFIDEVRDLLARGFHQAPALRSVGYRQVVEALATQAQPATTELADRIAQATRVFARHQLTWLRREPVRWLRSGDVADYARSLLNGSAASAAPLPQSGSAQ